MNVPGGMRGAGFLLLGFAAIAACRGRASQGSEGAPSTSGGTSASVVASSKPHDAAPKHALTLREGSTIARAIEDDALYVADEDHAKVHRVALPLAEKTESTARTSLDLPGKPAQILAIEGGALVTVRDPGLLVALRREKGALVEDWRVAIAADAWGLAIDARGETAFVTSAWTHQVSAVDLKTHAVRWSIDVAREPRGVIATGNGAVYVSHLTRGALTKIDAASSEKPAARDVPFPAAPLRLPVASDGAHASLGYALALSADGSRLYAPRHALDATFGWRSTMAYPDDLALLLPNPEFSWAGAGTVDVLLTEGDRPLAPARAASTVAKSFAGHCDGVKDADGTYRSTTVYKSVLAIVGDCTFGRDFDVEVSFPAAAEPRAIALRRSKETLLVADEGTDTIAELDARAIDPSAIPLATYSIGDGYVEGSLDDPKAPKALQVATRGAAPSGVALSSDDATAWIFARATYDLVEISLDPLDEKPRVRPPNKYLRLADDALDADAAFGRRLFYAAGEAVMSGEPGQPGEGMSCSGCHPDGRDDEHVWHAAFVDGAPTYRATPPGEIDFAPHPPAGAHGPIGLEAFPKAIGELHAIGVARQTPTLAGRLSTSGPYGWQGQNATLEARILEGFALHRASAYSENNGPWWTPRIAFRPAHEDAAKLARALAAFLRAGLVAPPRASHSLTAEETRGREIFLDAKIACASCHGGADLADHATHPLPTAILPGFTVEPTPTYRTPSLLFVGGTAPYFHDGRATTLEQLVADDHDAMGHTSDLTEEDRAALVAYLRTL